VTPLIALPPSASVTFTVNGVQDLAGQPAAANSSTFTTAPTLDTVAPTVVFQSLANGEPALPVNSVFEVTMSEAVDVTSIPTSNLLYDYSTGTYRPVTVSLSANGRTITIAPNAALSASTQHSVTLNSVRDLSGNTMGGFGASFTTSSITDATAPQVSAINPADTLSNVPRNAKIQVRFDEPINGTTLVWRTARATSWWERCPLPSPPARRSTW
jgi:hypothetical protein